MEYMNIYMKPKMFIIWLLISISCFKSTYSEVYSAAVEMEELFETESVLITSLEDYIRAQETKLELIRDKISEYKKEHASASRDITAYVSNPINAFLLTKRLTSGLRQVESILTYDIGTEFLNNITNYRNVLKFPTEEDLSGVAAALLRLQELYKLDTTSLANGELNGVQYSTPMTPDDCYELGRQSYLSEDFYHTFWWMNEALKKISNSNSNETFSFTRVDVLDHMAFSIYKLGDLKKALELINELLHLMPNHERAQASKVYFEYELARLEDTEEKKGDDGTDEIPTSNLHVNKSNEYLYDLYEHKTYEMLCRGEIKRKPSDLRTLHCRYVTNNVPFLKLAPLKLEEAHFDPYIVIYHDVMYDSEIELIKRLARPRFRRATVQNSVTGALETANYRVSKSAWLKTEEDASILKVVQRTEDMTGLDMNSAEELQVANYGIGGHYEPHFDFARREEKRAFESYNLGNRIATVLFYMSDVEQGGATVFTSLRLTFWPKKGAAVFWYNLLRSGEGDSRTRHAACPVLTGSKWVANKWIHERRQEFRRKCDLLPDHGEFAV